jgi:uncharacterized cupredoxin-like copper-binding protein
MMIYLKMMFGDNTELEVACNVPGHYEDGMFNKVKF